MSKLFHRHSGCHLHDVQRAHAARRERRHSDLAAVGQRQHPLHTAQHLSVRIGARCNRDALTGTASGQLATEQSSEASCDARWSASDDACAKRAVQRPMCAVCDAVVESPPRLRLRRCCELA